MKDTSLATETPSCNLCGATEYRGLSEERYRLGDALLQLGLVQCTQCRLVFTSPRPTGASLAQIYTRGSDQTVSHQYCWTAAQRDSRYAPILKSLRKRYPRGRLLDVGCGSGDFLAAAAQVSDWQLHGVEPTPIDEANNQAPDGAAVFRGFLDDAGYEDGFFDIVTCWYVLEHVPDPSTLLAGITRVLKPGGMLVLAVPNYRYLRVKDAGIVCRLRTGRWSNLHLEEHLFQYTPASIAAFVHKAGLVVEGYCLARPFLVGGFASNLLKQIAWVGVRAINLVTGTVLGGIEVFASKPSEGTD